MAKLMMQLNREEVEQELPYMMICEAHESARWNTGRRRRMWEAEFTEDERKSASRIFSTSRRWALVSGVPKAVAMEPRTYNLWQRLGAFCAEL